MTQEEKQLLLKALCAGLPYGIKVCVGGCICILLDINTEMGDKLNGETFHTAAFNKSNGDYDFCAISEVKPYLRPMSSMTEEEWCQYMNFIEHAYNDYDGTTTTCIDKERVHEYLNFIYSHHLDDNNLISMGLALEAPEDMYV